LKWLDVASHEKFNQEPRTIRSQKAEIVCCPDIHHRIANDFHFILPLSRLSDYNFSVHIPFFVDLRLHPELGDERRVLRLVDAVRRSLEFAKAGLHLFRELGSLLA
jgi:hypothetical protein